MDVDITVDGIKPEGIQMCWPYSILVSFGVDKNNRIASSLIITDTLIATYGNKGHWIAAVISYATESLKTKDGKMVIPLSGIVASCNWDDKGQLGGVKLQLTAKQVEQLS